MFDTTLVLQMAKKDILHEPLMRLLFALLIFFPVLHVVSQHALPHYYLRVDADQRISCGQYDYKGYKLKRPNDYKKACELDVTLEKLKGLSGQGDIFIYIHGFSAGDKMYERYTAGILQEDYFAMLGSPYVAVVNIMYDTHPIYAIEKKRISEKACTIAEALKPWIEDDAGKITVLAHSMGNRVLLKLLEEWQTTMSKPFKRLVLAAPDLPTSTYEMHKELIASAADTIFVYRHNTDRVLGFAFGSDDEPRLGLQGPQNWAQWPSNAVLLDGSLIDDHDNFSVRVSNHRYFYTSKTGKESLQAVLHIDTVDRPELKRIATYPHYLIIP